MVWEAAPDTGGGAGAGFGFGLGLGLGFVAAGFCAMGALADTGCYSGGGCTGGTGCARVSEEGVSRGRAHTHARTHTHTQLLATSAKLNSRSGHQLGRGRHRPPRCSQARCFLGAPLPAVGLAGPGRHLAGLRSEAHWPWRYAWALARSL